MDTTENFGMKQMNNLIPFLIGFLLGWLFSREYQDFKSNQKFKEFEKEIIGKISKE